MYTMSDDQENQSDEISVLESIYNDDELTVERKNLFSGQFYAFISVPEKFLIIYKNLMNSEDELESIQVDYLPPICLYFDLPKEYPSKSPPTYKVSCPWLPVKHMVYLSVKLDELWKQNAGTPILYIWFDFLKNEALNEVEITNYLDARGIFTKDLRNRNRKVVKDRQIKCNEEKSVLEERKRFWNERRQLKYRKNSPNKKSSRLEQWKKYSDDKLKPKSAFEKTDQPHEHSSSELICLGESGAAQNLFDLQKDIPSPESLSLNQPLEASQINKEFFVETVKEKFGIDIVKPNFLNVLSYKVILKHMDRVERKTNNNLIAMLIGYNEVRTISEFKKGHFTCDICFQCQVGAKCTQFKPCNHVYCSECIHSYFSVRLSENTVKSMPCPHDKCASEASQHQIKEVLGEELYSRYDRLLLSATLDTMTDVVYCPRKGCQLPVLVESDKMAYCPSCFFAFCALCLRTYHGVQPCAMKNEEKRKLAMTYKEATSAERTVLEARYGKTQLVTLLQNFLSADWISQHSKNCPCCKTSIEKYDGCNKMVCTKCNTIFCWLCHTVLDKESPYKHFYDLKSKCYNQLFLGVIDGDDEDDEFEFDDENDDDIFHIYVENVEDFDDFYDDDPDDDDEDYDF